MKTTNLFRTVLLSACLLTSACTPKDEPIGADVQAKIRPKNNTSQKPGSAQGQFQFGSYPVTAALHDRQVEALEVIRLAIGAEDVVKTQFTKTAATEFEGTFSTTLEIAGKELNYSTSRGDFKQNSSKKWTVSYVVNAGVLVSLNAVLANSKTSLDQKNRNKTFVNLNESESKIELHKKDETTYALTISSKGLINGRLENAPASEKFELNLQSTVDAGSLNSSEVRVLSSEGQNVFLKDNGKNYIVSFKAQDSVYKMSGLCNATVATTNLSGGKVQKTLKMSEQSVEVVDSKFSTTLGACGSRPTVDLSRFLIN